MKRSILYIAGLVLLVLLFILSLEIGVIQVHTPLLNLIGKHSGIDATTVWEIRFPRAMGALIVGAALGVAGALAQGIFRNPLAEPSLIGLTSGATLGTITAISGGVAVFGSRLTIESAIIFSALSALLIYFLAPNKGFGFLITGIALSATLIAIAGILISISAKPDIQAISFWNFGSLTLLNNSTVKTIAPFIEVGFILALFLSRKLDIYSLGENSAQFMGISPKRLRFLAIIALAFLIGPSVSTVGSIAFLGLLVPHIVRLLAGPSHRRMTGLSAIIGADLLLLADLLARTIFKPHEIPLGLVTSLIGAPVLIVLLRAKSVTWVDHD
jgi:iron complex transport system permease protein